MGPREHYINGINCFKSTWVVIENSSNKGVLLLNNSDNHIGRGTGIATALDNLSRIPTSSQKLDRKEIQIFGFAYSRQLILIMSVGLSRCVCTRCYD